MAGRKEQWRGATWLSCPSPNSNATSKDLVRHFSRHRLRNVDFQFSDLLGAPYERIKADLATPRSRYRELTNAFVDELKSRCSAMIEDDKRALVLELFAQEVQAGLDTAVAEKRQELMHVVEVLWAKYRSSLEALTHQRNNVSARLTDLLKGLKYV